MDLTPEDIVRIDGVEFHGGEGFDGFYISAGGLVGWDDTPDVKFTSVDIDDGDGEYDTPVHYGVRVLTVSGFCYAKSSEQLGAYRNRFAGIDPRTQRVEVTLHGATTFGLGKMAAASKFEVDIPGRRAAFQLSRRFVDPYRYGRLNTTGAPGGSTTTVFHYGNAPATSLLTMTGSDANNYVILGPNGRRVEVNTPLTAGVPHTFDTASGVLTVGGAVKYGVLGQVDLWRTFPGTQTAVGMSNTDSANQLTVETWDTYI
ncbi:hypothetical protein [Curtobacterium sp. CFBP9011]|uniref:hypothetical protein n=1 Tax=Curtobacterium sp. CFBP9011 TaxID=3096530 RepID=UPI002A6B1525|nr:hypothetical protein [Curtobacterium sp. CFBP9011]MDY1005750.1 hypothetical protein [Curtobacterium sp. CFBP9011]